MKHWTCNRICLSPLFLSKRFPKSITVKEPFPHQAYSDSFRGKSKLHRSRCVRCAGTHTIVDIGMQFRREKRNLHWAENLTEIARMVGEAKGNGPPLGTRGGYLLFLNFCHFLNLFFCKFSKNIFSKLFGLKVPLGNPSPQPHLIVRGAKVENGPRSGNVNYYFRHVHLPKKPHHSNSVGCVVKASPTERESTGM